MKLFGRSVVSLDQVDEDLMLRVKDQDDQKAYFRLYDKFKKPIVNYIYSMVQDSALSDDLAQDVFLKVYRARATYTVQSKFSTWLWTIAKNTTVDHIKKKKEVLLRTYENEEGDETSNAIESLLSADLLPDEFMIQELDELKVRNCLDQLTSRSKEIVLMRIFSEETYDAIAAVLSIPVGTVKTVLFRSRVELKKCFENGAV